MGMTDFIWIVLLIFLAIGWFYPTIGLIALICMLAPVVYGFWKGGRIWCGFFCPRGNFLGNIIGAMSRKGKMPKILGSKYFRYGFMVFLLGYFTIGVINAQGDPRLTGYVFYRTILITTLIGIGLGISYQPRTWCQICPMGTLSSLAAKSKKNLAYKKLPAKKDKPKS